MRMEGKGGKVVKGLGRGIYVGFFCGVFWVWESLKFMLFEKPHLHRFLRGSWRCICLCIVTDGSWRFPIVHSNA
ncbi:uncharacterized protein LY79DRAFT_559613 [Colletotrichum navitas]|uniref:Transmembrane protein n=1 Tax=Colletotrichum navitas TaxID=681940 RepID=A0AAD8PV43_9PEZI|nr:uncharacterized protein LY79DRAFT_559613 [Colletotrichum navitas]KAK1585057.1 hypothetical protein LY79DRAFT_559613 [Colletotrichum navitas]